MTSDGRLSHSDRINLAKELPKVELHLHLDGSLSAEFMFQQAKLLGIDMPVEKPEDLRPYMLNIKKDLKIVKQGGNWQAFDFCNQFLQTEEALEAAVKDILDRLHADNVVYAEIRFSPVLHTLKGLTSEQALQAALRGFRSQDKVSGGLIVCVMRSYPAEHSVEMARLAKKYLATPESQQAGVVALDICGDEAGYPLYQDSEPCAKGCFESMVSGVPLVPHAGEFPDTKYETARNILFAMEKLKARRIGHGLALMRGLTTERSGVIKTPEDMIKKVKEAGIAVEVCLTSNTGVNHKKLPDGIKSHPAKMFYEAGLAFNLNCDNMFLSGTEELAPTSSGEIVRLVEEVFDPDEESKAWSAVRFALISGAKAILAGNLDQDKWRSDNAQKVDEIMAKYGVKTNKN